MTAHEERLARIEAQTTPEGLSDVARAIDAVLDIEGTATLAERAEIREAIIRKTLAMGAE
jgi:hypothetical protein